MLKDLNLPDSGSFRLRNGRTGEYFDQPVTVGNHIYDEIESHG